MIILEVFIGALPAISGQCDDDHTDSVSVSTEQNSSNESTPVDDRHAHEGNLNHRCHLGHCSFVVQETFVKLKLEHISIDISKSCEKLYFSFISKPFRPPIA